LGPEPILRGLNSLLPPDIAVRECLLVPERFHARFDAQSKIYDYRILNRETRSAIDRNYAWFIHTPLTVDAMRQAAGHLIGRHDFKAFESTGSPRAHTVRTLLSADWTETSGGRLKFQVEADGFLRCMVRNIVGTLVAVGRGKLSPNDVSAILDSRDRKRAGATAPGRGLFLVEVRY
jgi:tRNA pseudouridine38-40 synthase